MQSKQKIFITALIAVILTMMVITALPEDKKNTTSVFAGKGDAGCAINNSTSTPIGNQASTRVFSTSTPSILAFARISIGDDATNTVYLMFNNDATSTAAKAGIVLGGANTNGATSTTNYIDFGLNALFPYTGSVQGRTDNGSTTVLVTSCVYN
mgnify:CR=1 FL=1